MKTKSKLISGLLLVGVAAMFLFGCGKTKYKIDYCGEESFYEGGKSRYAAGEEVVVYYTLIATDESYSFYLDDQSINYNYGEKGIEIRFTMPDHDVKLSCKSHNDMEYIPDSPEIDED